MKGKASMMSMNDRVDCWRWGRTWRKIIGNRLISSSKAADDSLQSMTGVARS
jgi:hypothetical protein